jgi:hypothetical protein
VVGYSLGGERWDGKEEGEEEGEIEEESDRARVYIDFYRWNPQQNVSVSIPVGESTGDSATSLYGDLGLNPSIIPLVKSSEKNPRHHTVTTFQKNYIIHRGYSRYIPMNLLCQYILTVSPTGIVCRYIPIELEMELFSSVKITDEKISLVIPLLFADFLVVDGVWFLSTLEIISIGASLPWGFVMMMVLCYGFQNLFFFSIFLSLFSHSSP